MKNLDVRVYSRSFAATKQCLRKQKRRKSIHQSVPKRVLPRDEVASQDAPGALLAANVRAASQLVDHLRKTAALLEDLNDNARRKGHRPSAAKVPSNPVAGIGPVLEPHLAATRFQAAFHPHKK